jgi:activator of HSP90 ATPase
MGAEFGTSPAKYVLEHIKGACSDAGVTEGATMRVTNRRTAMTGLALAAAGSLLRAEATQQTMAQVPATDANARRTSLHQEVELEASASRIEAALLDSKQFTAFSGRPATIDPHEGGAFSMFSGMIAGRNVELAEGKYLVQAWRPSHWDPGVYSIVRFAFRSNGTGTTVVLDHTGFPEGEYDHLYPGWQEHYWEPLKKFFA